MNAPSSQERRGHEPHFQERAVSVRRRVVLATVGCLLLAGVASAVFVFQVSQRLLFDVVDSRLRVAAHTLASLMMADDPADQGSAPGSLADDPFADYHYESFGQSLQIWVDGEPRIDTDRICCAEPPVDTGWLDLQSEDGTEWRVYNLRRSGLQVVVAQDVSVLFWLSDRLLIEGLLPLLGVVPLVAWLLYLAVTQGLSPLSRLADLVRSRPPHDLDPLAPKPPVEEAQPLVDAINHFTDRLLEILEREKAFTSNAAHELLTPLAAIRSEAQLAAKGSEEPEVWHRVEERVDRAARLVEQLVLLARADKLSEPGGEVDLQRMLEEEVAELGPRIDAKRLDFELSASGSARRVNGSASALRSAIRNLLDNAVRYVPEAGRIHVRLARHDDGCELSVESLGRSIPDHLIPRLFERFVRGSDETVSGSGLGLSIVHRVAEAHGGSIRHERPAGSEGARFVLTLPSSGAASTGVNG